MNVNPFESPTESNSRTFMLIGKRVSICRGLDITEHQCRVIASDDAYYFIFPGLSMSLGTFLGCGSSAALVLLVEGWIRLPVAFAGGLIGGWIGSTIGSKIPVRLRPGEILYQDLTTEVTRHPQWPAWAYPNARVIIVPRAKITGIRYSSVSTFDVETDEAKFCVELLRLNQSGAVTFLREKGWDFRRT